MTRADLPSGKEYVLGTEDEEVRRLGLQHRVWRSKMLDAWEVAGISEGSRVADFGCGPGYASFDLAEIVGECGAVLGIDQSGRFVSHARTECKRRGLNKLHFLEAGLAGDVPLPGGFDAVWCRWVASFVSDLPRLLGHVSSALRPGGMAI
jgi:SAM-dependent methyltransferase